LLLSSTGGSEPAGGEQAPPAELEIPEIFQKYKDKWVAITVTQRDKNLQPTKGRVLADDMDRYRLRLKVIREREVCIFFAGEPMYPLIL